MDRRFELRNKIEADLDESFPRIEYQWPGEPKIPLALTLAIFYMGCAVGGLCVGIVWYLSRLYR